MQRAVVGRRAGPWSLLLSLSEEQSPVSVLLFFFFLEFKAEHQRHVSVTQAETHRTRAMECSVQLPRQGGQFTGEQSHLFCLRQALSTHFLQRMKTNHSTPVTSVSTCSPHPRGGRKLSLQRFHITDGLPYVTSPQLSPCKQILSSFRRKSLINKWCAQLCT